MSIIEPGTFEEGATLVMRRLRRATAAVLGGVGGISRPIDVSSRLGLDRSLAWKVWHVGHGESDLPSPAHVPGQGGYQRFLQAAATAGTEGGLIAEASAAFAAFDRFTREHAGDRATADIMLGVLSDEGRKRHELARRREGFRAQTHFLGVQARMLYEADALIPAPAGYAMTVARMRGYFGIVRTRPNVPWIISKSALAAPGKLLKVPKREPLGDQSGNAGGDQEAGYNQAPGLTIIREFCSDPLPVVRRRMLDEYTIEDELAPGPVGDFGAVDLVLGERITMRAEEVTEVDAVTLPVFTPAERLCFDFFVHESLVEGAPTLKVNSTVHGDTPYIRGQDYDMIPVPETFSSLGAAGDVSATPDVPRHREMLEWFLARLGCPLSSLRAYRTRMSFPPMPSRVAAYYRLKA
ncbi:MAG: hypothetical protein SFZ23_12385 [Planctomycetota bacterium]|nr:hypothetical protein [Planctomycetota bacterium]